MPIRKYLLHRRRCTYVAVAYFWGHHVDKIFEIAYEKSCNLARFWLENGSQCRQYRVLKTLQQWERCSHTLQLQMTPDQD